MTSTSQEEGLHQILTMLAPLSQISSLQNCEKVKACCVSHTVYGSLLWQPVLTETEGTHIIKDEIRQKESLIGVRKKAEGTEGMVR